MMRDFLNINQYKKSLSIFLMLVGFISQAKTTECPKHEHNEFQYECDLCGCATSSGSFGFGTLSNANFFGVRYVYQSFESINGIFKDSPRTQEKFNTYQLWAQIPVYKTLYVTATVPYQDLKREYTEYTEHIKGLGDINTVAWYKIQFDKKKMNNSEVVDFNNMEPENSPHSIQFGIGMKLPTGEFEQSLTDRVNPGFQVGTGSFDGIFALGYNLGLDKFGVNTLLTYYLKGVNKNDYQYGNQLSYSLNAYYLFPFTTFNLMPFAGVSGDTYDSIKQYGEILPDTDGEILNSSFGLELATKRIIFGANFTLPVSQSLFGDNVTSKNKLSFYVNYAL